MDRCSTTAFVDVEGFWKESVDAHLPQRRCSLFSRRLRRNLAFHEELGKPCDAGLCLLAAFAANSRHRLVVTEPFVRGCRKTSSLRAIDEGHLDANRGRTETRLCIFTADGGAARMATASTVGGRSAREPRATTRAVRLESHSRVSGSNQARKIEFRSAELLRRRTLAVGERARAHHVHQG
jgi:hypothetical protein